jgi:hypothetical protein
MNTLTLRQSGFPLSQRGIEGESVVVAAGIFAALQPRPTPCGYSSPAGPTSNDESPLAPLFQRGEKS